jgi:hypothetical protein
MINLDTNYNLCFYSSIIFISNILIAYCYKYYVYSLLFLLLLITSLIFHSNNNIYTLLIDKISIILVVLYGGYLFIDKINKSDEVKYFYLLIIIFTFIITIYLYYFGYCYNKYCFCEDKEMANKYHSLIHIISSVGHNLIIIM